MGILRRFRRSRQHLIQPMRRDSPTIEPPLDSGMIGVAKAARETAYAPQTADDVAVICHTHDVRVPCMPVKVESVRVLCENARMVENETTGARLRQLWEASGLSMAAFAKAAGYGAASGVQRYLEPHYDKRLPIDKAEAFATALAGHGVTREQVMALTGFAPAGTSPEPNAQPFQMEGASEDRMRRDVPIYGTGLGADEIVDGEAIEQTMLNTGDVVGYLRRPVLLDGRADIYGIYVQGSSMSPRHRDGATLFVEQRKPAKIGDDVVVYLRVPDEHDGERASAVLVKTLVRKTSVFVELEQYNPALIFRLPADRVMRMDRVVTLDELVS